MSALTIRTKYEQMLKSVSGVVAVSHAEDRIIVYVVDEWVFPSIPDVLEGIPVQKVVIGSVRTL